MEFRDFFHVWNSVYLQKDTYKGFLTKLDTQPILPTVFFVIFLVQNVHTNVT
jgi:hypothetical protein